MHSSYYQNHLPQANVIENSTSQFVVTTPETYSIKGVSNSKASGPPLTHHAQQTQFQPFLPLSDVGNSALVPLRRNSKDDCQAGSKTPHCRSYDFSNLQGNTAIPHHSQIDYCGPATNYFRIAPELLSVANGNTTTEETITFKVRNIPELGVAMKTVNKSKWTLGNLADIEDAQATVFTYYFESFSLVAFWPGYAPAQRNISVQSQKLDRIGLLLHIASFLEDYFQSIKGSHPRPGFEEWNVNRTFRIDELVITGLINRGGGTFQPQLWIPKKWFWDIQITFPRAGASPAPTTVSSHPSGGRHYVGPTNYARVPSDRPLAQDSKGGTYLLASSIPFKMKGFSELGVTLGAITNGRHLPTFENGDALAFPGTYQKKMFVRISWPGYGSQTVERQFDTNDGKITVGVVILQVATFCQQFFHSISRRKIPVDPGFEEWDITGRPGFDPQEVALAGLIHRGSCRYELEIWHPKRWCGDLI